MTAELDHIRVQDVMHHGILSCAADAPLGEVAGIMATHHVHAVAVMNGEGLRPIGVVSDLDVVAAGASGEETSARQAAATEPVAVSADESLHRAAQLMSEHGVSPEKTCARIPFNGALRRSSRRHRSCNENAFTPRGASPPVAGQLLLRWPHGALAAADDPLLRAGTRTADALIERDPVAKVNCAPSVGEHG